MNEQVLEFLRESNSIERVYDDDSMQQAIYAWEYLIEQETLTIHDVLRTHWILMKNQNLHKKEDFATQEILFVLRINPLPINHI